MTNAQSGLQAVARLLLALIFILSGFGKTGDVQGFAQYMASGGVPAFLAWPVILFEIGAGLALLVGFLTRPVAAALAVFALVAGVLYHGDFSQQMQMTQFLKNLAMSGGYVMFAIFGPGSLSVDEMRHRRVAA